MNRTLERFIYRFRHRETCRELPDLVDFDTAPERAVALRRKLGIDDDESVLLYVGKFLPEKRLAVLLDEFLEFRRSHPDWQLILAGEGPEEMVLREMTHDAGTVHFLPLPDAGSLPVVLRAGDLVALVSRFEDGRETIAAAMRCGRPVLATDGVDCAAALIEPGRTGWCLDSAHPELWFDYPAAASREDLKRMGEAAALEIAKKIR